MVDHMKAVAQQPQELSVEERNLLSVAYKNVIGSRRASWRVIASIEQKGDPEKIPLIQQYKRKIEIELEDICSDILEIIKNELIPNSDSDEGKVFYYKMKVRGWEWNPLERDISLIFLRLSCCCLMCRVTTIDIWRSFRPLIPERNPPPRLWKPTTLPSRLPSRTSPLPTLSVWAWRLTSLCSTTKF